MPYLVVLTSASEKSISDLVNSKSAAQNRLSKRQYMEEEYAPSAADAIDTIPAEVIDSIPTQYDDLDATYEAEEVGSEWGSINEASRVAAASPLVAFADNSTSIFEPKPNSGLFHRYIFFSSPLIFGECGRGPLQNSPQIRRHC
jgi:hypothetical protein